MSASPGQQHAAPFDRVRRLLLEKRRRPLERCDFCGADLADEHGHLINVATRELLCSCRPCYLLFTHSGAGGGHVRAVPSRYRALVRPVDVHTWRTFQIPVDVVFFFFNSATGRVTARYPSPAGVTEAELPEDVWSEAVRSEPALGSLSPDVEALLVRHRSDDSIESFLVPIDACYELAGRLRRAWRGFQGGDAAWQEVDDFFVRVRTRVESGEPS